MALSLRKPVNHLSSLRHFQCSGSPIPLIPDLHGRLCCICSEIWTRDQRRCGGRERRFFRRQMFLFNGSSLPMSSPLDYNLNRRFRCSHGEVQCLLSSSFSQSLRSVSQEKMQRLISRYVYWISNEVTKIVEGTENYDNGRSKPLSFHLSYYPNYDPNRYCSKVPYLRKLCFSESPPLDLHGKMSALNLRVLNCRAFSGFSNANTENNEDKEEIGGDDNDDSEGENVESEGEDFKSTANPKEVERVCKVIEELFSSDRNMEAVLDQCGVDLSHDLVVDVLDRFRHARRPAFRFFCWAGQKPGFSHDSRTYNSMMSILGKTRQFESMVAMLEEMGKMGLLTMETFSIAIRAFAAAREMKKALGIFELMKRHGLKPGVETFNCLLDELGRAKLGKEAQMIFEKLKDRFPPNLKTYSILLSGWCKVKNLLEAGKVWNEMVDKGLKPDIVAHNTMLEGLLRGRRRSEAIKLFELMKAKGPSPNVRSYTILIRDLCKGNKMEEAVEYFDEMLNSDCKPDPAIYTCLMVGFGNQKKMDKVYGLLKEMKEKDCLPDGRTYNALIKLMTNRQMSDDAVRIYKKMIKSGFEPTIHTYNMMMKSFFQIKNYDMGCAVWDEMSRKGCCPDDNSYTVFIGGLIRNGRSEEACKYVEEMIDKGMKAPQLDYNKFAADFSRAGKPDILRELAQKMKFSGKFEVSNVFERWSEMMQKRVKRRDIYQTEH